MNDAITTLLLFGAVAIQAAALFYAWRVVTGLHRQVLALFERLTLAGVALSATDYNAVSDEPYFPDAGQDEDTASLAAASAEASNRFLGQPL